MIRFECDYAEGAHPKILERLMETNDIQTGGYTDDPYSDHARALIRGLCGREDADVHFLVGGTQTNLTVIASILRPHQGVICAASGHINVHETGAVEATGHKVLTLPSRDGKITAKQVQKMVEGHWADINHEHVVQPGMVYISQPTENGTMYSKQELTEIYEVCRETGLPLYIDGARLGYALASPANDLTMEEIAGLCDVFYIGGTKVGAMFGEAVVVCNPGLKQDFRYYIKQRGGLLAKGRFLGLQFEALLEDGLYFEISKNAVERALEIRKACEEMGFPMLYDSMTNQQFPVLRDDLIEKLGQKYAFFVWEPVDAGHSAVRFCTSWKTTKEQAEALAADLRG